MFPVYSEPTAQLRGAQILTWIAGLGFTGSYEACVRAPTWIIRDQEYAEHTAPGGDFFALLLLSGFVGEGGIDLV